jgi:hypothetical protein
MRASSTNRSLFRGIRFLLDQDPDNYVVNQYLFGDADTLTSYITVEDCTVEDFSTFGIMRDSIVRRCNITGMGGVAFLYQ